MRYHSHQPFELYQLTHLIAQRVGKKAHWDSSSWDLHLRPPEVILGVSYTQKADMWMLGCAVCIHTFFQPVAFDSVHVDVSSSHWPIIVSP